MDNITSTIESIDQITSMQNSVKSGKVVSGNRGGLPPQKPKPNYDIGENSVELPEKLDLSNFYQNKLDNIPSNSPLIYKSKKDLFPPTPQ
jgi:hypothetical protein